MMKCLGICLVLLATSLSAARGQDEASPQLPTVTLSFPSDVSSESAHIDYFMIGPFGGWGNFVKTSKEMTSYEIAASVDGKPAAKVKIVAYFPGCEIQTVEVEVQPTNPTQFLKCKPIGQVTLRGQLPLDSIPEGQQFQVDVDYLAPWTLYFFGISDGPAMSIHIGSAVPARDGSFEIEVPDFSSQSKLGKAAFQLILRERKTGNLFAFLKPADEAGNSYGLEIQPDYPQVIQFNAEKH